MKPRKDSDVQVVGNRVLVKQPTGSNSFNWVCIAEFHYHKGVYSDPAELARQYAEQISA